jgi:hypothetical protein
MKCVCEIHIDISIFGAGIALSDIALDYGLDDLEFEYRQRLGIFLFTTTSRPAPASYTRGKKGFFPGSKSAGA